jgi:hypothetical protein
MAGLSQHKTKPYETNFLLWGDKGTHYITNDIALLKLLANFLAWKNIKYNSFIRKHV